MSLVGPRPEDPHYVELYSDEDRAVLAARPGVTSLAALLYRDEERLLVGDDWEHVYVEQVMPAKLAIDRAYVERQSFWLDLKILAATALAPLRLEGLINLKREVANLHLWHRSTEHSDSSDRVHPADAGHLRPTDHHGREAHQR